MFIYIDAIKSWLTPSRDIQVTQLAKISLSPGQCAVIGEAAPQLAKFPWNIYPQLKKLTNRRGKKLTLYPMEALPPGLEYVIASKPTDFMTRNGFSSQSSPWHCSPKSGTTGATTATLQPAPRAAVPPPATPITRPFSQSASAATPIGVPGAGTMHYYPPPQITYYGRPTPLPYIKPYPPRKVPTDYYLEQAPFYFSRPGPAPVVAEPEISPTLFEQMVAYIFLSLIWSRLVSLSSVFRDVLVAVVTFTVARPVKSVASFLDSVEGKREIVVAILVATYLSRVLLDFGPWAVVFEP